MNKVVHERRGAIFDDHDMDTNIVGRSGSDAGKMSLGLPKKGR